MDFFWPTDFFLPADAELFLPADVGVFLPADTELFLPAETELFLPADVGVFTPALRTRFAFLPAVEVFLPGVVLFFAPPAFAFDELAEVMLWDGFDFESPVAGVARALEADFFGDYLHTLLCVS